MRRTKGLLALMVALATPRAHASGELVVASQLIVSPELSARLRVAWDVADESERLLAIFRGEIGRRAPLLIQSTEELGLDPHEVLRCNEAGSFACWIRASARRVDTTDRRRAAYLLVVSMKEQEGRAQVSALFMPISEDRRAQADRILGRDEAFEEAMFAESLVLDAQVALDELPSVGARFGQRLAERFGDLVSKMGTLVIRAPAPGFEVRVDGEQLGAIGLDGRFEHRWITGGPHELALLDPAEALVHDPIVFQVKTGTVTVVDAILRAPETRVATFGGLALAGVGVALVAYSFAAPTSRDVCVMAPCASQGFVTFGEGGGGRSAIMIAPLGYSLALSGAAWAVSPYLLEHSRATPWLELGLGLLIGAASYAISAAASG